MSLFSYHGSINIWGWIILCCEGSINIVGVLTLGSNHDIPVTLSLQMWQPNASQYIIYSFGEQIFWSWKPVVYLCLQAYPCHCFYLSLYMCVLLYTFYVGCGFIFKYHEIEIWTYLIILVLHTKPPPANTKRKCSAIVSI